DEDCEPHGFGALGLEPALLEALRLAAPSALRPTAVQLRAIPALLRGRHTLLAAETGSGKTLGYLLPLMQRLLHRPPPSRAAARQGSRDPESLPRPWVCSPSRNASLQPCHLLPVFLLWFLHCTLVPKFSVPGFGPLKATRLPASSSRMVEYFRSPCCRDTARPGPTSAAPTTLSQSRKNSHGWEVRGIPASKVVSRD
uniref:DEAD/DEAH-box helicase domain-containing protein n=1 Tax=Ornithorhynchus anatinus TaxID=9258 RepID=A0A6I8N5X0_ORNAN